VTLLAAAIGCGGGGGAPMDAAVDAACKPPVGFTFAAIGERSFASFGASGQIHNVAVQDGTPFGVRVKSCEGCDGICSFEGPTDPVSPVNRRRCLNRMSVTCSADTDCPPDGPTLRRCVYIYDPPAAAPLRGLGNLVGACGWSYIPVGGPGQAPTVAGTIDQTTGEVNLTQFTVNLPLNGTNDTYRGACTECVGDPTANDGIKGGRCMPAMRGDASDPSPDLGAPCDVHRYGTIPGFDGAYSMDCSPSFRATDGQNSFGGLFTSSGFQMEVTAASPNCTDPRFAGQKCFCGVCPDNQTSCASSADCNGQPCGYLPAGCDPNPPPRNDDGTVNPAHNASFATGQCRGAGVTSFVTVGGNTCRGGTCNWDPDRGLGSCTSVITGMPTGCYPTGLGAKIVAPGRAMRLGNVFIVDTATARCHRLTGSPAINSAIGLPGITFQRRSFRVIPTEAP
jgi:hypothetical protein